MNFWKDWTGADEGREEKRNDGEECEASLWVIQLAGSVCLVSYQEERWVFNPSSLRDCWGVMERGVVMSVYVQLAWLFPLWTLTGHKVKHRTWPGCGGCLSALCYAMQGWIEGENLAWNGHNTGESESSPANHNCLHHAPRSLTLFVPVSNNNARDYDILHLELGL